MSMGGLIPFTPVISTRDWSMETLLGQSPNFKPAERVSFNSADLLTVIQKSEENGTPLVIQDFHMHPGWPKSMFTLENFSDNSASPDISVRNIYDWTDEKIPLADFVAQCRNSSPFSEPGEKTRYYGKDAECPRAWEDWLHKADVIPNKFLPGGSDDVLHSESDTVSIETLMCYLGIGDTFTPCHKDLCASSGQNLMCYTENDGASFWFMTKSGDAGQVDRYFLSLGQDLDHENHVITTCELARGNFTVYVVKQQLGDLVLVPPRSCHQVVNYGGITVKTSWSRMTLDGLETAVYHELPLYQRVCRFETYRVKSTVHRVLQENVSHLQTVLSKSKEKMHGRKKLQTTPGPSINSGNRLQLLLRRVDNLLRIYSNILAEEFCEAFKTSTLGPSQDSHLVCDFCGCDVFQSFFECQDACFETDGDGLKQHCVICPGCFVEGRSCACRDMKPMQRYDFKSLLHLRQLAIELLEDTHIQHSHDVKFSKALKRTESPHTFKAACALHRFRATAHRKRCSTYENGLCISHECLPFWILPCAPCHRARCFAHIAQDFKMHSIDALLHHHEDEPTQENYHTKHQEHLRAHKQKMEGLANHQEKGTQPKGSASLLYNALHHNHCRPVKPAITSAGWYDEVIQGVSLEDHPNGTNVVIDDENPLSDVPPLPPPQANEAMATMDTLFIVQDERDNAIEVTPLGSNRRSAETSLPPAATRKRKYSVFVEIPPRPYRIRVPSNLNMQQPVELSIIQTPRATERNETIVARSGLRARRSRVERSAMDQVPLKNAGYVGSSYVRESASPVSIPKGAASLVHLSRLPRIKRYDDPGLYSSNTQLPMATSTDLPKPPHAETAALEDRHHAFHNDMQHVRRQRLTTEYNRAEIYKQTRPPKDAVFYKENGQLKFGHPPQSEPEHATQTHHHATSWSQPSSSQSDHYSSMHMHRIRPGGSSWFEVTKE